MKRIAMVLALAGCVAQTPFAPTVVTVKPGAFDRVTRVLLARGESIETKDEGAGIIVTKWDEKTSMGTVVRQRWNVTIDADKLTVDSQCQMHITSSLSAKDWEPCGNQGDERAEAAKSIAAEAM